MAIGFNVPRKPAPPPVPRAVQIKREAILRECSAPNTVVTYPKVPEGHKIVQIDKFSGKKLDLRKLYVNDKLSQVMQFYPSENMKSMVIYTEEKPYMVLDFEDVPVGHSTMLNLDRFT